ncbi:hypothetical protein [Nocardia neocaledoniensis]|uniref:hypothetical protein n=1 Tax=Nocardia neocaledoniensis TaxID=236511 RepID=UPI0024539EA6|nr:hypothetical protein [Nocardia neocaledoniensis]
MSDQEDGAGPGESRFDAVEQLRRKWEESKTAEAGQGGGSNVVRLPRPPRRGRTEASEARRRPWYPEPVYDPAPTRPVTRAELQQETGAWPAEGAPRRAAPASGSGERDADVIDLGASRRRRAGTDSTPGVTRPRMSPRRVGPGDRKPGDDSDR